MTVQATSHLMFVSRPVMTRSIMVGAYSGQWVSTESFWTCVWKAPLVTENPLEAWRKGQLARGLKATAAISGIRLCPDAGRVTDKGRLRLRIGSYTTRRDLDRLHCKLQRDGAREKKGGTLEECPTWRLLSGMALPCFNNVSADKFRWIWLGGDGWLWTKLYFRC